MSDTPDQIPIFPRWPGRALRLAPLMPVQLGLNRFVARLAREHPKMFRRLGEHGAKRFEIDPVDLPVVILLEPREGAPKVTLARRSRPHDARIAGPLAALLGLVHGAYDGDALFFSRDLVIEGDTAAVLALRNAIDAAELDLAAEIEALAGPARGMVGRFVALAEKQTGVALTRHEEAEAW
ncbi:MAG: SCP2 sterol-binding domain-containing protein [Paracoccaceae bacterium]|jgi:predicted lipid carrier protein YhbT